MRTIRFISILAVGTLLLLLPRSKCFAQYTLVASYIGGSAGRMANSQYQVSYSLGIPMATNMSSELYQASSGFTAVSSLVVSTITLYPTTLPAGILGQAYDQTFTAVGGTAPYSFTVTAGSLPPGLSLSENGDLSGTPSTVGVYGFTLAVSGGSNSMGKYDYTLTIISPGSIVGAVTVSGSGLQGVTVKLLDADGFPSPGIDPASTDAQGHYSFMSLALGDYLVMIVEPLGFAVNQSPKPSSLTPGETDTVDFILSPTVLSNSARSIGYWKHQFDVYLTGRGNAQESSTELTGFIELVHSYFTPHFSVFASQTTFEDWQGVLTARRGATTLDRAKQQLAALVLNFASLKIGQNVVVSDDNRTAGDLLTYTSTLVVDGNNTNDELAKDLAEKANTQQLIGAGIVPSGNILFKGGGGHFDWSFGLPTQSALYSNYPNPFNSSTVIKYDLQVTGFVSLRIYNTRGQEVAVLANGDRAAGRHSVEWNAQGMASGVYFYKLVAGEFLETRKLILLK